MEELPRHLLDLHDGVITRRQLLAEGLTPENIRSALRYRMLAPVHRGVFVAHTGDLTWRQRVWSAHLASFGSVLAGTTALAWSGCAPQPAMIALAVEHGRRIQAPRGVRIVQVRGLADRSLAHLAPPRMRVEEAALDVVASTDDPLKIIALVSDLVQQGRSTPARLRTALDGRARQSRRNWLERVPDDLADGSYSVLEHGYLHRVERAHRLPKATRQAQFAGRRSGYRDVEYRPWGLVVELDGAVGHTRSADRWADMQRDLEAAAVGSDTLRVGWWQVQQDPCRTAQLIGQVLRARGWPSEPVPCGTSCALRGDNGVALGA